MQTISNAMHWLGKRLYLVLLPLGRKPDIYASRMARNDDEGIGRRREDGDYSFLPMGRYDRRVDFHALMSVAFLIHNPNIFSPISFQTVVYFGQKIQ